jgi:hypothetical protein
MKKNVATLFSVAFLDLPSFILILPESLTSERKADPRIGYDAKSTGQAFR